MTIPESMASTDTIYALATPLARSGVAVVRVSGKAVAAALEALGVQSDIPPRIAHLRTLTHPETHEPLDQALVLRFAAPHSFTGEEVAEFHLHGSLAVIKDVLAVLSTLPHFRLAEPGEFARRAFWNGKLDLTAAEGLADLIEAETSAQRRQALRLAQGEVKLAYDNLRQQMLRTLAYLEAYIDFPEEDLPPTLQASIRNEMDHVMMQLRHMLDDAAKHEKVREGLLCVIAGAPNVGKSTLINALMGREVAIISPLAGTTRDRLEAHTVMSGIPVTLVDTAGVRQSEDAIEQEGVKRALHALQAADVALYVMDAAQPDWDDNVWAHVAPSAVKVLVWNKIDVTPKPQNYPRESLFDVVCEISACERGGAEPLSRVLEARLANRFASEQLPMITRVRHRELMSDAYKQMEWARQVPVEQIEIACEYLRSAAVAVGKITGIIAPDEVLGHIFGSFCIGK